MKHYSEEELIAYQLHEGAEGKEIVAHLEVCLPCAAVSDAIAETLRVYSAERVPEPAVRPAAQRRNRKARRPAHRRRNPRAAATPCPGRWAKHGTA